MLLNSETEEGKAHYDSIVSDDAWFFKFADMNLKKYHREHNPNYNLIGHIFELCDANCLDMRSSDQVRLEDHNGQELRFPLGPIGAPKTAMEAFRYYLDNPAACYLVYNFIVSGELIEIRPEWHDDLIPDCGRCLETRWREACNPVELWGVSLQISARQIACIRHAHRYKYVDRLKVDMFYHPNGIKKTGSEIYECSHRCATDKRPSCPKDERAEADTFWSCLRCVCYELPRDNKKRDGCKGSMINRHTKKIVCCACRCRFRLKPELDLICLEITEVPEINPVYSSSPAADRQFEGEGEINQRLHKVRRNNAPIAELEAPNDAPTVDDAPTVNVAYVASLGIDMAREETREDALNRLNSALDGKSFLIGIAPSKSDAELFVEVFKVDNELIDLRPNVAQWKKLMLMFKPEVRSSWD